MTEISNTLLWDQLKKTDPKATKPFKKGGGFTGTQIDPVWRAQRMTEVFGPIGKGWGYDITERWSEEFKTKDGTVSAVYVTVNAWYTDPATKEKLFTGPQIGGTEVGRAADEAYKMAVTDALTKCLVNIGLCADVYLGLFDDSKYREEVGREFAEKRQDEKPDPKAIVAEMTKALRGAKDRAHLDGLWDAVKTDFPKVGKAEQDAVAAVFDQEAARVLTDEFGRCGSLDALRDLWSAAQGYMHPMTADQKAAVTDAKDVRKRALMAAVPSQAAE